jgi:ribonuclease HI
MRIEIYTDGSATVKTKPGGYGWVIVIDGKFHSEGSGSIPNATNNDAELEAAIIGLANAYRMLQEPQPPELLGRPFPTEVTLVSDSQIVLGWVNGTYRFKQITKNNKYESLMRLKKSMNVQTRWVEGHTGDQWNERCDKLAGIQRRLAMGIEPKKRVDRSALLKKACKSMSDALEYIKRECEDLRHQKIYIRDDFIDKAEFALEDYAKALEKMK